MSRESVGHTLIVAVVLCVVCSLAVSSAAISLRPLQIRNKERERQKNILKVTGLYDPGISVEKAFGEIETRLVDLETGRFVPPEEMDPNEFDQRRAAKDPELSREIAPDKDIAGIRRRERYSLVYFVRTEGKIDQIVLPVYGNGLWSTMYGFLSLEPDATTVKGLTFYEHGETPGLGGEIDNPAWKSNWVGKKVYDQNGVKLHVIKGTVDTGRKGAEYEIDGLAGATLTANGVSRLIEYWMGPEGFEPFLKQLRSEGLTK